MKTLEKQLRAIDILFDEMFIYRANGSVVFNSEKIDGNPTVEAADKFKRMIVDVVREEGIFFEDRSKLFEETK